MKKAQKTRLLRVGSLAMAAALLTACGSGTSSRFLLPLLPNRHRRLKV